MDLQRTPAGDVIFHPTRLEIVEALVLLHHTITLIMEVRVNIMQQRLSSALSATLTTPSVLSVTPTMQM